MEPAVADVLWLRREKQKNVCNLGGDFNVAASFGIGAGPWHSTYSARCVLV